MSLRPTMINFTGVTTCIHHGMSKMNCHTRIKLIEKEVYCTEEHEFLWKTAFYRIMDNLRTRDRKALSNLLENVFQKYKFEADKCEQAHLIHCEVANFLNYRQSFFGYYTKI